MTEAPPIPAAELAVPCSICNAGPGERCHGLVNAAHVLPISHARRRALAQSAFVKEMQP